MDNWDDLKYFLAVHRSGTMVAAARHLGANVATVSRRIERLGQTLGAPVFIKTSGDWKPNPDLESLLYLIEDFEGKLSAERNQIALKSDAANPVMIRVGAPPIVLGGVLSASVGDFLSKNKGYTIELHNRTSRSGLGDVDIMIMDTPPDRGSLITRRVGKMEFNIFRRTSSDLGDDWVGLVDKHDDFEPMRRARALFRRPPSLRAANFFDAFRVSKSTGLPVLLPTFLAKQDSEFQPAVEDIEPINVDFWAAFHSSRKKDQAAIDAMNWIISSFEQSQAILLYID